MSFLMWQVFISSMKSSQIKPQVILNSNFYRMLLVGKSAIDRNISKIAIEMQGHVVSVATSGFNALELLKKEYFDVVVLEQDLSGMSWETFCKHIHNELEQPHLPILFVTNSHIGMDVINKFQSGIFDFIRKPCDTIELINRINLAVQKKRRAEQLDNVEF